MLSDGLTAIIRTVVPVVVGTLLGLLADWGLDIDPDTQATLSAALIPICISGYYVLVAVLERKVSPAFGWLLGAAKAPKYKQVSSNG